MSAGLLIDGHLVEVPGLTIVPPADHGGPDWNRLGPDDFAARQHPVSILVLHTTGGHWPQPIIGGGGPAGHARQVIEMWSGADHGGGERDHSGSQLVVDFDGRIYCAGDLTRCAAYHAQAINQRAVGVEMCTRPDGGIYEATLDASAALVAALTHSGGPVSGLLPIPAQMPRGPYRGQPLRRLEIGGVRGVQTDGSGLCGVIGHRDQTGRRGRGDPGDAIWQRLAALGFEGMAYDLGEDLDLGKRRQRALNTLDARAGLTWSPLVVDGVCGGASIAAMRRHGLKRWRDVA